VRVGSPPVLDPIRTFAAQGQARCPSTYKVLVAATPVQNDSASQGFFYRKDYLDTPW
jgi:hypothetical protein